MFPFPFPFARFRVRGQSMKPALNDGDYVVVWKWGSPRTGDIVAVRTPARIMVKRVVRIQNGSYFVCGDNSGHSSRSWVSRTAIMGKVWFRVPASHGES